MSWVWYLAKVNFVKDNLSGMADAPEAGDETENGDESQGNLVIPFGVGLVLGSGGLGELVELDINFGGDRLGRLFGDGVALAQRALRRSRSRHDCRDCRGGQRFELVDDLILNATERQRRMVRWMVLGCRLNRQELITHLG